jgi:hypothetical protein
LVAVVSLTDRAKHAILFCCAILLAYCVGIAVGVSA